MRALRVLAVILCLLITPAAITSAQVPGPPQLVDVSILIRAALRSPIDATDQGIVFPFDGLARVRLGGVRTSGSAPGTMAFDHGQNQTGQTAARISLTDLGIDIRVKCRLRQEAQADPGNFIADCNVTGNGTETDSRGGLRGQGTGGAFVELFDGRPVEGSSISLGVDVLVVCAKLCEALRA